VSKIGGRGSLAGDHLLEQLKTRALAQVFQRQHALALRPGLHLVVQLLPFLAPQLGSVCAHHMVSL
jgi:hypothetical protein